MPVLDDLLRPGLDVVFCGTRAGHKSAAKRAYYAGPGNRFWSVLHDIGLTDRELEPFEYRDLLSYGIGLTDIVKLTSGPDSTLSPHDLDVEGFRRRISEHRPRFVAFNGKRVAAMALGRAMRSIAYGIQPDEIEGARVAVLPSTSGAARAFWNVQPWQNLASRIRNHP